MNTISAISLNELPVPDGPLFRAILRHLRQEEVPFMLIGALAAIIQVSILNKKKNLRGTRDIDLAICLDSWEGYEHTRQSLVKRLNFTRTRISHRLVRGHTYLDLIPFGGLERPGNYISWPEDEGITMNVAGFQAVYESARQCKLDTKELFRVPSLPGLVFLKLNAWIERREPRDAQDLAILLSVSFDLLQDIFFNIHGDLLEHPAFDSETAGCRACGREIRKIFLTETRCHDAIEKLLEDATNGNVQDLVFTMAGNQLDKDRAIQKYANWVRNLLSGIRDPLRP